MKGFRIFGIAAIFAIAINVSLLSAFAQVPQNDCRGQIIAVQGERLCLGSPSEQTTRQSSSPRIFGLRPLGEDITADMQAGRFSRISSDVNFVIAVEAKSEWLSVWYYTLAGRIVEIYTFEAVVGGSLYFGGGNMQALIDAADRNCNAVFDRYVSDVTRLFLVPQKNNQSFAINFAFLGGNFNFSAEGWRPRLQRSVERIVDFDVPNSTRINILKTWSPGRTTGGVDTATCSIITRIK